MMQTPRTNLGQYVNQTGLCKRWTAEYIIEWARPSDHVRAVVGAELIGLIQARVMERSDH